MSGRTENLLGALATALSDAVESATAATSGLGGGAAAALASLWSAPGLNVDAVADTVGITGSGAARLVDRLVTSGLAERRAGRDKRSVSVWLTPAGEDAAAAVLRERSIVLARSVGALSTQELRQLEHLVEKILAQLTRDRSHAELICRLCDVQACPAATCPVEQAVP